jgi:hypothetical protein
MTPVLRHILWRDKMDVPSRCAIVRTMGRSANAPEALSRRNKTQKPKRKKRLHSESVKLSNCL